MAKMRPRGWRTLAELALLAVVFSHVLLCPFTKVEESFNIQVRAFPRERGWMGLQARQPRVDRERYCAAKCDIVPSSNSIRCCLVLLC